MDPRALLDELMGKDRDLPFCQQKKKRLRFDDPEVCHYHLVAFCPHDLFPNTKSDLGACEKIHDDGLREDFLKSNRVSQYEAEFLGYLERLIADLERKIKRCHERLDKEMPLTEHARANSDRISAIAVEVQALLKQAEREGEDGLVDQAQATMTKVENMNKEKDQLVRAVIPEFGSILEKERRMQVCEVCGAMQASTDTEKRLASHLEGKQHLGYYRIRQTAEHLRKKKEEEREARRRDRDAEKPDGAEGGKAGSERSGTDLKEKEKNGTLAVEKERELDRRKERRETSGQPRSSSEHEMGKEDWERMNHRNSDKDRSWEWQKGKGRNAERERSRGVNRTRHMSSERGRGRSRSRSRSREGNDRVRHGNRARNRDRAAEADRQRVSYGGGRRDRNSRDGDRDREQGKSWFRHQPLESERS